MKTLDASPHRFAAPVPSGPAPVLHTHEQLVGVIKNVLQKWERHAVAMADVRVARTLRQAAATEAARLTAGRNYDAAVSDLADVLLLALGQREAGR